MRRRSKRDIRVAAAILVAFGAGLVVLSLLLRGIPRYSNGGPLTLVLGIFLMLMGGGLVLPISFIDYTPRQEGPRWVEINRRTITASFADGRTTTVHWADPTVLTRVLDFSQSPLYRPEGPRFALVVDALP